MQDANGSEPRLADLRRLLDAAGDALATIDGERVAWANAALARLVGVARREALIGTPVRELLADAPPSPGGAPVRSHVATRDGGTRPVLAEALAGDPGTRSWILRLCDRGEHEALEAELLRLGRALHDANRELARLRERARREAAEREELLTIVSHELRTPCTVIQGYNRLLLSGKVGPLSDQQRHFLEESQKSCQRLNAFIGNLLETARHGQAVGPLELAETPLAPLVEGVVRQLQPLLAEHGLRIELALADAPRVRCDPPRVEQVLLNLLGNALKYAPAGSAIEVVARACAQGGRRFVEVAVSDAGPGVEPADRERIFAPYVQAGDGRKAGGLGLGLAICRGIVEAHGGRIAVEPRPGGGSRFFFTLPEATGPIRRAAGSAEAEDREAVAW